VGEVHSVSEDHIDVRGRATRAQQELVETEAAFKGLRQAMFEEIAKTSPEQLRKRDFLIASVQILDAIRRALVQAVAAGQSANYHEIIAQQTTILRP
jgi:hypothetical protein